MSKQQTAVDWLFEQIPAEWSSSKSAFDAYQQAKQMEKEQIMNAVSYGNWYEFYDDSEKLGEHYYNEKYKP
jgi:hypothetical protein